MGDHIFQHALLMMPLSRFIYQPTIASDANFHMYNLFCSSDAADPGLHTGLAYYVKPDKYKKHILKHITQTDVSLGSAVMESWY